MEVTEAGVIACDVREVVEVLDVVEFTGDCDATVVSRGVELSTLEVDVLVDTCAWRDVDVVNCAGRVVDVTEAGLVACDVREVVEVVEFTGDCDATVVSRGVVLSTLEADVLVDDCAWRDVDVTAAAALVVEDTTGREVVEELTGWRVPDVVARGDELADGVAVIRTVVLTVVFSVVLSVVVVRTVLVARAEEDAGTDVIDEVEVRTSLDVGSDEGAAVEEAAVEEAGTDAVVVVVALRTSLDVGSEDDNIADEDTAGEDADDDTADEDAADDDTAEVDGSATDVVVVACTLLGLVWTVEEVSDGASVVVRVPFGCAATYSPRLDSASSTRAQASMAAASSSAVSVSLARASAAK